MWCTALCLAWVAPAYAQAPAEDPPGAEDAPGEDPAPAEPPSEGAGEPGEAVPDRDEPPTDGPETDDGPSTDDAAADEPDADEPDADEPDADASPADVSPADATPGDAGEGEPTEGDDADEAGEGDDGGTDGDVPTADTGIRGRIVDSQTGEGLPDAVVIARSRRTMENTITNETGGYVLVVPRGRYSVLSYTDLYHGARMPRVIVRRGRFTDLTLTLDPIDAEAVAEEVEIVYRADTSSAAAQDQLRAASSGIGEGMGSEQMSQSGASDAGSAARSVVGVSLEGTNLNIRGLGGRYTLVLLNGVQLPSTDPDAPSVDLDLFPTSVIDNLQVSKAFLPNLPANFAGGVLDIRTVRFPQEFTFQLAAGVGFNSLSTFQEHLTYQGGDLDWLGFDDGTRDFPQGLDERLTVSRSGEYNTREALEEAAEQFPNTWQYQRQTAAPPFSVGGVIGDSVDLGEGNRLGYLLTVDYDYAQLRGLGFSSPRPQFGTDDQLEAFNEYDVELGQENVALSSLGTASLELGQDDVISYVTLFNRSMTDETQRQVGVSGELGGNVDRWQLQYVARMMWFNQLRGDHRNLFGSRMRLRWGLYGSYATREEPDRRTVTYGPQGSLTDRWLEKSQSGERFYSDLEQLDFGGTLDFRFPLWSQAWGDVGAHLRTSTRGFENRRLRMLQDPSNMDPEVYLRPVEELFSEEGIGTWTRIQEFTRETDSYSANQNYLAAYAMLETPMGDRVTLQGGARLEVFQQFVSSFSPFPSERMDAEENPDEDEEDDTTTDRVDVDVLPGAALRFELLDGMYLRAAYGMTVARPNIRELAPYAYYDFIRDRNISGNSELNRTLIQNADVRWEWFFGEGEIIALSAFYKYFDQPIELQILNQMTYDSEFINANLAHNVGGELEFRFNFRHFHEALDLLSFNGNFTLIWSTVELPEELSGSVRSQRPLVGQSPYVANLSLAVDEPDSGLRASVVYNLTGPRITDVGTRVGDRILPDIQRAPFHSLDLVVSWQFIEHLQLKLKLKNLLFQSQEFYQGDFLTQRVEPGMSASLTLRYSY
ncbi:MAG TPA: TonB-dependent receptor [Sandaracinaceae bacterium LLY-WYZ-13_1]|nr:TonB-dependent receptor [Sandaracinaceae bacterium LLY-WYZ-13_1]